MQVELKQTEDWPPLTLRIGVGKELVVSSPAEAVALMEGDWPVARGHLFNLALERCKQGSRNAVMARPAWLAFRAALTEADWQTAGRWSW